MPEHFVVMPVSLDSVGKDIMFSGCLSAAVTCPFVRLFDQTDLLPYNLMNGFSNLDQNYREYSLAPTDEQIRFWTSKVKVTAFHQGQIL